jgi:predicted cobalt transporter CbtA
VTGLRIAAAAMAAGLVVLFVFRGSNLMTLAGVGLIVVGALLAAVTFDDRTEEPPDH